MSVKSDFTKLISMPTGITTLSGLNKIDWGFSHVARVLEKAYQELGFNEEGFFPALRVKIESNQVVILNLTQKKDLIKPLINQPYIQDRYDKFLFKLGQREQIQESQITINHQVGEMNYPITLNYQVVSYRLVGEVVPVDKILPMLINNSAKLLTYELTKQFYCQVGLPSMEFDLAGQSIMKFYQDLYYVWLNQV